MNLKIINYISYGTLISALVLLLVVFYWLLYPYEPIEFNNMPHAVENKQVKPGDHLIYTVEYCKNSTVVPIASKYFIDGLIYAIPDTLATVKEVGCGQSRVQVYVPRALPKGKYFIEASYRYQVNPIRYIDVVTRTEQFEVI